MNKGKLKPLKDDFFSLLSLSSFGTIASESPGADICFPRMKKGFVNYVNHSHNVKPLVKKSS